MESYAGLFVLLGVVLLVCLGLVVMCVIANWKLFEKAGEPGGSALIPFYNSYQMAKIATGDVKICWAYVGVSILSTLVSDLPQLISGSDEATGGALSVIISLASLVIEAYVCYMFAKSFGQSTAMCVLSIFFGGIIFIILAFSKSTEYVGPKGESRFGGYNNYNSYDKYGY
jgi:hypothetical protein